MSEIKDYQHLFLGSEVKALDGGTMMYYLCGIDRDGTPIFKTQQGGYVTYLSNWKLVLRPLSDMTEEEALKICSIVSPTIFGDYRYKKWTVSKDRDWDYSQKYYDVKREGDSHSFTVDCIDGDVLLYDDNTYIDAPFMNFNYKFEYLKMHFDLFGLIDAGLAIDKTKINLL